MDLERCRKALKRWNTQLFPIFEDHLRWCFAHEEVWFQQSPHWLRTHSSRKDQRIHSHSKFTHHQPALRDSLCCFSFVSMPWNYYNCLKSQYDLGSHYLSKHTLFVTKKYSFAKLVLHHSESSWKELEAGF